MFNADDDLGPVPSTYLAEIVAVDVDNHTCSVILLRGMDQYDDVLLLRTPGDFSLPTVGDLCSVIWDNQHRPFIIGFYPTYHKEDLDSNKNYNVQEGERLLQSEFGQKLLMNKTGKIVLTNWTDSGLEINEQTGIVTLKSTDSNVVDTDGTDKRSGVTKRKSAITRRQNTVYSTTGGIAGDIGTTSIGVKKLIEDATIIEEESTGTPVYTSVVGNIVVDEGETVGTGESDTITIPTHSKTGKVLRAKTTYYTSTGLEGIDIEIDIDGNTSVVFPTSTTQINIEELTSLAEFTLQFKTLTLNNDAVAITATTSAKIDSASVELGTLASAVKTLVFSDVLVLLAGHTHTSAAPGSQSSPSLTLVTELINGTHETLVTKAN